MAGFIGRVNMLEGRFDEGGWIESPAGRLVVETDGWGELKRGDRVFFCVRPHDVKILRSPPPSTGDGGGGNVLRGRVKRRVYLGETRDYLVALENSNVEIRAVTSPDAAFSMGEEVTVQLTPSKCSILAAT